MPITYGDLREVEQNWPSLLPSASGMVLAFVFVGLFFGAMYRAVRVLGRRVNGEEFERCAAGVDEVVERAARDDDHRPGAHRAAVAFDDRLALAAGEGEHLVDAFVHLF